MRMVAEEESMDQHEHRVGGHHRLAGRGSDYLPMHGGAGKENGEAHADGTEAAAGRVMALICTAAAATTAAAAAAALQRQRQRQLQRQLQRR